MSDRPSVAHAGVAFILLVSLLGTRPATGLTAPRLMRSVGTVAESGGDVDHQYKIGAKVRFLFFWASAADVGGARITWRGGDRDQVVSLLIGSEPQRAPREVNVWGYIREDVSGDAATIFGIRTVTDGDSPDAAEARRRQPLGVAEFAALCSTVSAVDAVSRTTTVSVSRDTTYRDVDRVLAALEQSARGTRRFIPRPAGVAPGFLTALDQLLRSTAASARQTNAIPTVPRVAYVYKDAVYDLIGRRVRRIPQLRTHARVFQDLLRADLSIRNRATGSTTDFSVTYGTEGALAGVPVSAHYQPNWWFRIDLALDLDADAPHDPADQPSIRQRIDTLCRSSAE